MSLKRKNSKLGWKKEAGDVKNLNKNYSFGFSDFLKIIFLSDQSVVECN